MSFTSLNQYLTLEWLEEAYRRTRKDGAVGVDGQTAEEYAADLQSNLKNLLEQAKSGRYVAPPVRRGYIPKDGKGGEQRPIGIPTFEDKLLQRAISMILEPIYEQDFLTCSYGFRPKRSAHDCIKDIRDTLYQWRGGYIIDADIKGYFDSIDQSQLRAFLDERVRDGVIRRLIGKWLKAGVREGTQIEYPETGTVQGGVISPLMSNIYLHKVLDEWFIKEVEPRMLSSVRIFRFADDFIIICKSKEDADRIMDVLPKRFERFGLTIHPEKTKQLDFNPPKASGGKPPVFDFLGFTFYWGKTRKGQNTVKLKTRKARFKRSVRKIHELCRAMRHEPIKEQQRRLNRLLVGTYNYYGVSFNFQSLSRLRWKAGKIWHFWLNRRSQRNDMPWKRFEVILGLFPLAPAKIKVALF
ncbi:MAG: group II intron reverse transcriptase/maturase [Planctomycetes bacterium]|nr:group II intron reverse transcriptase/maturase [Planctomycetota bacterium]